MVFFSEGERRPTWAEPTEANRAHAQKAAAARTWGGVFIATLDGGVGGKDASAPRHYYYGANLTTFGVKIACA